MVTTDYSAKVSNQTHFSKDQWIFLRLFFGTLLLNTMIFALQGPLYPPEATSRGVSPSVYGVVMAAPCASMAVFSPFATYVERIGLIKSYIISIFLSGFPPILMALLYFVDSNLMFVILSFLILALQGIGSAGILASVYILCLTVFPGAKSSIAIGVMEAGSLTGACFAPILCELLFTASGFSITYMVFGFVQILMMVVVYVNVPEIPISSGTQLTLMNMLKGYGEIIKCPSVLLFTLALAILEMGDDFVKTMLEPALKQFHLTHMEVGVMFFLCGVLQLLAPLWGVLLAKFTRAELVLAGSTFVIALSWSFLGPLPFMPFAASYSLTVFALILYGLGQGIMDVAAVVNFQLEVREKSSKAVSFNFVGICYAFMTGVGGLVGPAVAGVLYDNYGFGNALLFVFVTHASLGVSILVYMSMKKCHPRAALQSIDGYDMLS